MIDRIDTLIADAIGEGLLPPSAARSTEEHRPWPVVLLTALGAWLAAAPLLFIVSLIFGGFLTKGAGPYIVGGLVLAGSIALLRKKTLPLFMEQLAVPGLLVGGATFGIGQFNNLDGGLACLAMALVAIATAALVARHWLRILLGAAACGFVGAAIAQLLREPDRAGFWLAVHVLALTWVVVDATLRARPGSVLLDRLATGWIMTTLAGLAIWTGMTFMAGAAMGTGSGNTIQALAPPLATIAQVLSAILAAGGAGWLAFRWAAVRKAWFVLASLILVFLAALMPSLGAVLLVLALCASTGRTRMAGAAGFAAAWIVGALYYQLAFPLQTKALMLVGAGAALGVIAWLAMRGHAQPARQEAPDPTAGRIGIALAALAILTVANVGIWQKETLIAEGRPVFVELAPADPRSIMQGDYMRLNFRLPDQARRTRDAGGTRLKVVGQVDARGIAELARLDNGSPLPEGSIAIELTPRGDGWTVVSDAWYFKEGEAARWERARYGEFRVTSSGKALLVGMRGPNLEPL